MKKKDAFPEFSYKQQHKVEQRIGNYLFNLIRFKISN